MGPPRTTPAVIARRGKQRAASHDAVIPPFLKGRTTVANVQARRAAIDTASTLPEQVTLASINNKLVELEGLMDSNAGVTAGIEHSLQGYSGGVNGVTGGDTAKPAGLAAIDACVDRMLESARFTGNKLANVAQLTAL